MKKTVYIKHKKIDLFDKELVYKKSNYYCPLCGKQEVWEDQGEGDFYEGVDYACTNCYASFTLPSLGTNENDFEGEQLIKQLRSNKLVHSKL